MFGRRVAASWTTTKSCETWGLTPEVAVEKDNERAVRGQIRDE